MASFDYRLNPLYPIKNVRIVELCTLQTIVVLMEVSWTRSFVILIKHPNCLNDPLRIILSVETQLMVIIVKDVLFYERNLRKICLHIVLKMEFSKILLSHPMTIPTLLMLFKSHSLSNKTPVKIPHKVLYKSTTIVVTGVFLVIHQLICEKTYAELLAEEQEANINTQPFQYSSFPQPPQEEMSVEFLQEKRNQMDSVKTFLRKFNRISFYEMPKVLSLAWETILEIELAFEDKHCQPEDILELFRRLYNDVQNIHEELALHINTLNWDRPTICYDDDDDDEDYAIAITPSLSTEEPDNSLKDQFEDFSDSNDESTSIDDDSFSIDNIEYVEASPPDFELVSSEVMEIVISEVGGIDDDILLTIKDEILREKLLNINLLIANIEALKDNPNPSFDFMTKSSSTSLNSPLEETNTFDNSLTESETFCFDLEDISSGSTTTRFDISLLEYEAFYDDHVKEISSGNTTTHSDSSLYDSFIFDLSINPFPPADRSDFYEFADELAHILYPPEYDCFCFKNKPNSGGFHYGCGGEYFSNKRIKSLCS
nr:hypothetical protein [Tanacetum cinerariifolium]